MTWCISFFGLGYVGLTTAVAFASKGFQVVGFDVDKSRVKAIGGATAPFYELGLNSLLREAIRRGVLRVTVDYREAIASTDITFITVGTPLKKGYRVDLQHVRSSSRMIGRALRSKDRWHLVVVKSTVPPGTTEGLIREVLENESGKKAGGGFGLVVNPEFLREGSALEDTFKPDRVVLGGVDEESVRVLEGFYRDFYNPSIPPIVKTTPINAELIKYASNAFLAMKVSFINMFANLCQKLPGADVEAIAKGIGLDKRIGSLFLKAGVGWGGSCLPKDLKTLKGFAKQFKVSLPLVDSTLKINDVQPYVIVKLAKKLIGGLRGCRVAVLGLSFKPNTDDMRNAVSIKVVKRLISEGASVVVYDPAAMGNARRVFRGRVEYASSAIDCLRNADCALIVTEWDEFKNLTPKDFIKYMRIPAVVDGRRIYNPSIFSSKLRFTAVGLGSSNS